ncbi:MAG: hypothetical protein RLZZ360_86 [Candidatus Parcubacteria bacterium]|jgi:hypothetical protein
MHVTSRQLALLAIGIGLLLWVISIYTNRVVREKLDSTSLALKANIAEQELVLATIADLTKRNEADEITERIVVDCQPTERQRFEVLLDKLSASISKPELSELDRLFFACGRYFADKKSVMAARLAREVTVYDEYITLRSRILETEDEKTNRVALWQRIAEDELTMAADFTQLVELQGDIILALLAGKSRDSEEIMNTLKSVTDLKNNMTVRMQQIETTRRELQSL